jgi:uncharacterized membrane protein
MCAFWMFPTHWSWVTRSLLSWNIAVWLYLILMLWLSFKLKHESVKLLAHEEDESALAVLIILSISAGLSLLAIVLELTSIAHDTNVTRLLKYGLTIATIVGSWLLLGVVFTFHYACLYFASLKKRACLVFPDQDLEPDYWDFLYFSFTIAVALQTSDISIHSRVMRQTVLAQSILSFFFNAAILGFSINMAASIVGN